MPKHHRHASGPQNHYANHLTDGLPTSPLYAQQPQRISVPASYYTIPAGPDSASMSVAAPQASFESYTTTETVSVPPPAPHRASSGAWSVDDDRRLVAARMQGLNWGQIKDNCFPDKSANACRKRHERLMERKGVDDWDTRKLQALAKEYMSMRKEIWSGLAARTGEKWNVVEAKCMSNGLKNLQSAARAASRRERLETQSHAISGYDDDSGISGIGLTPVDELDASFSSPEPSSVAGANHSFSSSSATTRPAYHLHGQHQQHAMSQAHLQPSSDQAAYGIYGAAYGAHHGYSSSVSSSASMGQRYASRGNSPYMDAQQRLSANDMGIEREINRQRARRS